MIPFWLRSRVRQQPAGAGRNTLKKRWRAAGKAAKALLWRSQQRERVNTKHAQQVLTCGFSFFDDKNKLIAPKHDLRRVTVYVQWAVQELVAGLLPVKKKKDLKK